MLEVSSLVCVSCGGPLNAVTHLPAVIACGFCGAVMSVAHDTQTITQPATPSDELEMRALKRQEARPKFVEEIGKLLAAGKHPYEAVRDAWNLHLGFEATAEPIARLTIALARDFEAEQGVSATDAQALSRIAEAYFKAIHELRVMKSTEMNLPFLAVNEQGPKHLARTVTPAIFAELARRDPYAKKVEPPKPEEPPAPEPKKRKKLFGIF